MTTMLISMEENNKEAKELLWDIVPRKTRSKFKSLRNFTKQLLLVIIYQVQSSKISIVAKMLAQLPGRDSLRSSLPSQGMSDTKVARSQVISASKCHHQLACKTQNSTQITPCHSRRCSNQTALIRVLHLATLITQVLKILVTLWANKKSSIHLDLLINNKLWWVKVCLSSRQANLQVRQTIG